MPPVTRSKSAGGTRSKSASGARPQDQDPTMVYVNWLLHHNRNESSDVLTLKVQPNTVLQDLYQQMQDTLRSYFGLDVIQRDIKYYTVRAVSIKDQQHLILQHASLRHLF